MRRLLTGLGLVLMMYLVCISCDNDDDSTYPAEIKTGVWSGGNGSTGFSCDVTFIINGSIGQYCMITTISPDKKETGTFEGRYMYDSKTGTATVNFEATTGAPSKATLQFDKSGEELAVSFTSVDVNFGDYTVKPVTYPSSIAGTWISKDPKIPVTAKLETFAVNGEIPCEIVALGGVMKLDGFYNYTGNNGKGSFKVTTADGGKFEGTFEYNVDGSLTCKIPSLESILTANGIKLERLISAK